MARLSALLLSFLSIGAQAALIQPLPEFGPPVKAVETVSPAAIPSEIPALPPSALGLVNPLAATVNGNLPAPLVDFSQPALNAERIGKPLEVQPHIDKLVRQAVEGESILARVAAFQGAV